MRKKVNYKSVQNEGEKLYCELCNKELDNDDLVEVTGSSDSTIVCIKCEPKLSKWASLYDE